MARAIASNKISRLTTVTALVGALLFFPFSELRAEEPTAIAFGDIQGYFEPCGCDPKTDLGGMSRLSGLVARERRTHPKLLLLSLGNSFDVTTNDQVKNRWIGEALTSLKADATLFNYNELLQLKLKPDLIQIKKQRFVLSNVVNGSKVGVVKSIKKSGFEIFGFVEPRNDILNVTLLDAERFVQDVTAIESKLSRVLLFSGSEESLKAIAQKNIFATIVSANKKTTSPVLGKIDDAQLIALADPKVMMVPYGGQGVLRFGEAVGNSAKSLGELLQKTECKPDLFSKDCSSKSEPLVSASRVSWLSADYLESSTIQEISKDYQKQRTQEFDALKKDRLKNLKDSPYAGAEACKSCHVEDHKTWTNSQHANAFQVLVNAGKQKDAECVACHVVGFKEGKGFIDLDSTPNLANVQCENCHGPRKGHVTNPALKGTTVGLKFCEECHHGQHSPDFQREQFWSKIMHGKK